MSVSHGRDSLDRVDWAHDLNVVGFIKYEDGTLQRQLLDGGTSLGINQVVVGHEDELCSSCQLPGQVEGAEALHLQSCACTHLVTMLFTRQGAVAWQQPRCKHKPSSSNPSTIAVMI